MVMLEETICAHIRELWQADRAVHGSVWAPIVDGEADKEIDLVGVMGNEIAACETKVALSQGAFHRALALRPHSNQTWIGVERPVAESASHVSRLEALRQHGVGVYYVSEGGRVDTITIARTRSERTDVIAEALASMQQSITGGRPSPPAHRPDRWEDARRLLRARPGLTAKEIALDLDWTRKDRTDWTREATAGRLRGVRGRGVPARYYMETTNA